MRLFCKLMLSVLLAASVARAQTPSTDAPAKTEPATPAPDSAQAAPKADAPRPYVESALTFLRAFTHTNRTGPEERERGYDVRPRRVRLRGGLRRIRSGGGRLRLGRGIGGRSLRARNARGEQDAQHQLAEESHQSPLTKGWISAKTVPFAIRLRDVRARGSASIRERLCVAARDSSPVQNCSGSSDAALAAPA